MMRLSLLVLGLFASFAIGCGTDDQDARDVVRECHVGPCPTLDDPSRTPMAPRTPSPTAELQAEVTPAPTSPSGVETSTPIAATTTGTLDGYVHIGPTCPVVREGEDCDDRPHEAEMDIVNANGDIVATVRSDGRGRFVATLAPGAYRLVPRTDGGLPYASEQEFQIEAGRVTEIDVAYDSGIR